MMNDGINQRIWTFQLIKPLFFLYIWYNVCCLKGSSPIHTALTLASSLSGHHPGQHPLPTSHHISVSLLPHRVAPRSAPIGWPVWRGMLSAGHGLEALALSPHRLAAEPGRLLLYGLPVDQGEGSAGGAEGGASAGGGPSQQLSGHVGSVSDPAGNGGVAVREHQTACDWR